MKWSDIPMAVKGVAGLAAAVTAALMWLFATFETQAQSQQQWQYHQQAVTCNRVSELRLLVERIRWELKDPNMPQHIREAKAQELAYLEREIARLDPNGVC